MQKLFKVVAVMMCPLLLIGCATIVSGRSQKVAIATTPSEAVITINGMVQKSPCVFTLDRTIPMYQIKIEKEGYKTVEISLRRGVNGWIFGNILFGGLIGIAIDICSGSANKFTPSEIEQNLVPVGGDAIVLKVNETK